MSLSRTTLPPIAFGTGGGLAPGVESLPAIETRLLFVDKGTNAAPDGSRQEPFHTIAAALAQAAVLAPGVNSRVAILIYPGEYAEDGLNSVDYVDMIGVGPRGAVRIEGANATTYTVDNEHTTHRNLTFANTGAFRPVWIVGAMSTSTLFVECGFEGGTLASFAVTTGADAECQDCHFTSAGAPQVVLGLDLGSAIVLRRCIIVGNIAVFSPVFTMEGCTVNGVTELGNGEPFALRCNTFISATYSIIIYNTPIVGIIHNNRMVSGAGLYDLIGGGPITGLSIEGNVMTRGIHGTISHVKPERNVGAAGMLDFYPTLQLALNSCTFDDIVVRLLIDITTAATLTYASALSATIDGIGKHTLSCANFYALTHTGTSALTFRDIIVTAAITLDGAGASLIIEDSTISAPLIIGANCTASSVCRVIRSFVPSTGVFGYAIIIYDADCRIYFEWSRIKGAGFAAIYFGGGGVVNNNIYIKHSTLWHGLGAANDPFARDAAQVVTFKSHHSEYNSIPGSGWATNLIPAGQTQDAVDVNGDY